jgi:hypothetical protein
VDYITNTSGYDFRKGQDGNILICSAKGQAKKVAQAHSKRSRLLTKDVLHTASFHGCVRPQTGRIQLSAQLLDVKSIILESI